MVDILCLSSSGNASKSAASMAATPWIREEQQFSLRAQELRMPEDRERELGGVNTKPQETLTGSLKEGGNPRRLKLLEGKWSYQKTY